MTKFRHPRPVLIANLNNPARPVRPRPGEGPKAPHRPVVYYVRFADLVKIGTSHNVVQRMNSLPHDGLMAVEDGWRDKERTRHIQFAHLRRTGEWFELAPDLAEHIVDLREAFARERGLSIEAWLEDQREQRAARATQAGR